MIDKKSIGTSAMATVPTSHQHWDSTGQAAKTRSSKPEHWYCGMPPG